MVLIYALIGFLPSNFKPGFSPRINELFFFLKENDQMKRKEAAEKFLGNVNQSDYFNKLLHELKIKLTRSLLADPSKTSNAYLADHEPCYRNFVIYKMLLANAKRKAAIEIATYLLPKLKKLEMFALAHGVAIDLMHHYSHSGKKENERLANKYRKQAKILLDLIKIESIVKDYHSRISLICNNRKSFTRSLKKRWKILNLIYN